MSESINLTLKVWRQNGPKEKGRFETYPAEPDLVVFWTREADERVYDDRRFARSTQVTQPAWVVCDGQWSEMCSGYTSLGR